MHVSPRLRGCTERDSERDVAAVATEEQPGEETDQSAARGAGASTGRESATPRRTEARELRRKEKEHREQAKRERGG